MSRRNQRSRQVKRWRTALWSVVLVAAGLLASLLIVSVFFDDMGVRKYLGMLNHAHLLEQEIRDLEHRNAELRTDIYRTQHDPARIEELARERLGYVKKGDTVYQIVPEASGRGKK